MAYVLHVTFKSNEHPWSTNYETFYQPESDETAIVWATGMNKQLEDSYICVLKKDGLTMIDFSAPHSEAGRDGDG